MRQYQNPWKRFVFLVHLLVFDPIYQWFICCGKKLNTVLGGMAEGSALLFGQSQYELGLEERQRRQECEDAYQKECEEQLRNAIKANRLFQDKVEQLENAVRGARIAHLRTLLRAVAWVMVSKKEARSPVLRVLRDQLLQEAQELELSKEDKLKVAREVVNEEGGCGDRFSDAVTTAILAGVVFPVENEESVKAPTALRQEG